LFVNQDAELRELDAAKRGGLLVVFGRRRVGKTRLLRQWLQPAMACTATRLNRKNPSTIQGKRLRHKAFG
jgi:hypothetical protein